MRKYLTYDDVTNTPDYSEITSRSECDTTPNFPLIGSLTLPIISAPMDTVTEVEMSLELKRLGAVGAVHRFLSIEDQVKQFKSYLRHYKYNPVNGIWLTEEAYQADKAHTIVISVGATGDYLERATELINSGVKVLLIDVAHGHHINVKNAVQKIKSEYPKVKIIAGNISTQRAYYDYIDWGVDAARVGVGGGSMCETRIRSGIGLPMFTTIQLIADAKAFAGDNAIPFIADGGIRTPGDVAKAIGAGADMVMLGSLLAGTKETPNEIIRQGNWPNEQLFKKYYGAASAEAKSKLGQSVKNVEGNSVLIPYKGKVERIITDIKEGLQSAMSYVGAHNIEEYQRSCNFVEITQEGQREARPHLLG